MKFLLKWAFALALCVPAGAFAQDASTYEVVKNRPVFFIQNP